MVVLNVIKRVSCIEKDEWFKKLIVRCGKKVVVIVLVNKIIRIVFVMLKKNECY